MAGETDIDFREQLELYAAHDNVIVLVISLLGGQQYFVTKHDTLIIGPHVVTLLLSRGGESFFPFEAICSVDVRFR